MSSSPLNAIVIEPGRAPEACVIWLHGLGADGNDFVPIVPELGLRQDLSVRFIFPHAPVRPVTLNGGAPMRAWFDIHGLDANAQEDLSGLENAREQVEALLAREQSRGVPTERTVLAGFSQGGATALYTGLRHRARLAGIMVLSAWLPAPRALTDDAAPANRHTPLFLAHGERDPVVDVSFGRRSQRALADAGYATQWHTYPMEHQVCGPEIRDIGQWLTQVLEAVDN